MQLEHDIKIIAIDKDYEEEVKRMQAEGWQSAPGFPPFAIFPVVRPEQAKTAGFGGQLGGHIDDSKVHIIQGGKE